MSESELKTCPFCSSKFVNILQLRDDPLFNFIAKCFYCNACIARKTREEVVEAWNRRA